MSLSLASLLPSEPINHGEGEFISLVELNACSGSIPRTPTVLYDTEEKRRFVRSELYYFAISGQTTFAATVQPPHHSCGDPNAVVFTLAVILQLSPLGSTVESGLISIIA
jgi:hypothetical protein